MNFPKEKPAATTAPGLQSGEYKAFETAVIIIGRMFNLDSTRPSTFCQIFMILSSPTTVAQKIQITKSKLFQTKFKASNVKKLNRLDLIFDIPVSIPQNKLTKQGSPRWRCSRLERKSRGKTRGGLSVITLPRGVERPRESLESKDKNWQKDCKENRAKEKEQNAPNSAPPPNTDYQKRA